MGERHRCDAQNYRGGEGGGTERDQAREHVFGFRVCISEQTKLSERAATRNMHIFFFFFYFILLYFDLVWFSVLLMEGTESQCRADCPGTHYVQQAGLELFLCLPGASVVLALPEYS